MGDFNFHIEDVKVSKIWLFSIFFELLGLIQQVSFPTHKSGHTLDLIITKEENTLCISDPVDKFYISDHSYVYEEIRVNKPQTGQKNYKNQKNEFLKKRKLKMLR